jgi:CheY-like chemotaxis protein
MLLDIGLPDLDGYQVARALRQQPQHREVLIVAVTGYGREQDHRYSAEAGIDAHLVKPIDADELMRVIENGRHETA